MTAFAAPALAAEPSDCFLDKGSAVDELDRTMRILMLAHAPVEHRKSCGLASSADQVFYDAIKQSMSCADSERYDVFFSKFLNLPGTNLSSKSRDQFHSEADWDSYCSLVEQIDLEGAVTESGELNQEYLISKRNVFSRIRNHIASTTARQ